METLLIPQLSETMTADEFYQFASASYRNGLRMERDANGNIITMPPIGESTGYFTSEVNGELSAWHRANRSIGRAYTVETGFTLPNNAVRAPDGAWISWEHYHSVAAELREKFAHICPDFVIEIRSPSDRLKDQKAKMTEWIENGCRLGWLIDPEDEQVFIYRPNQAVQFLDGLNHVLSGEDVLPGFLLDLGKIVESIQKDYDCKETNS